MPGKQKQSSTTTEMPLFEKNWKFLGKGFRGCNFPRLEETREGDGEGLQVSCICQIYELGTKRRGSILTIFTDPENRKEKAMLPFPGISPKSQKKEDKRQQSLRPTP